MKKLLLFLLIIFPYVCYAQLIIAQDNNSRAIDAKYIIAIESKKLILHEYYKQKYNKRKTYINTPSFAFSECKNIGVFSENLHVLVERYDYLTQTRKDTMFIIPLTDITAIIATKNEALYGKSGVMHIIALPLLSVGLFVTSIVNFGIGEPQNAFPALGASAGFGLLFWWSLKSLQNEKKYTISTKKWQIHSD